MLHRLHNDCDINLGLNLYVEACFVHVALLIRAESLLTLEFPDINLET